MSNLSGIIFIATLVGTAPALAGWNETGRSDSNIAYVDVSTIKRNVSTASMDSLLDKFSPTQIGSDRPYSSIKTTASYNCDNRSMQVVSTTYYAGRMGQGVVVRQFGAESKWNSITPDGADILSWKIACGLVVKK